MKEYNRDKRIWEEVDQNKKESLKQRELCIGQKPHHYELTLPDYIQRFNSTDLSQETIQKFYELEDQMDIIKKAHKDSLREIGINANGFSHDWKTTRYFRCSICNRKVYNKN